MKLFLPQKLKKFSGPAAPLYNALMTYYNSEIFFAKRGIKYFGAFSPFFPLPIVVEVFGQKGQKKFGAFGPFVVLTEVKLC